MGEPFQDAILGPVSWIAEKQWWCFDAHLSGGALVPCTIITHEGPTTVLPRIRQVILWLRENEPQLRHKVAAGMFDYLEREYIREPGKDQVDSAETIHVDLRPAAVTFFGTEPAEVWYDAVGLLRDCGWKGVTVEIDAEGRIVGGPSFA